MDIYISAYYGIFKIYIQQLNAKICIEWFLFSNTLPSDPSSIYISLPVFFFKCAVIMEWLCSVTQFHFKNTPVSHLRCPDLKDKYNNKLAILLRALGYR